MQDASIKLATKSKREVRALGAREHIFWLMDQKDPVHLTVTAEVKGVTTVQNWRDALDAVQKRHLILRLLHASYSLIPYLLENTESILSAACTDTRD